MHNAKYVQTETKQNAPTDRDDTRYTDAQIEDANGYRYRGREDILTNRQNRVNADSYSQPIRMMPLKDLLLTLEQRTDWV